MAWPEEPEDSVNYSERELFSNSDLTLRMLDNSRLDFWGTLYMNGEPWTNLGGRVDVRSFGCNCDGTDDGTALQNAIDSGFPLIVPKGVKVSVGKMIIVPSGMDLQIDGRIERIWTSAQTGGASAMFYGGSTNKDLPRISNVRIHGMGSVGCPSQTVGRGIIFCLGLDDSLIENITVDTYYGGQAFLVSGHRLRMHNVKVINSGVTAGTGGIRFCGGDDFIATNCHIESGDDCLQFVPGEVTPSLDSRRGAYIGCTGFSTAGRFIAVISAGSSTATIEDCSFIGCHGKASLRGIVIDAVENAVGSVRRISVRDCSINMSNDTQTGARGAVYIQNLSSNPATELRNITLDNVTIIDPSSVAITCYKVDNVTINNCVIDKDRTPFVSLIDTSGCHEYHFTNNEVLGSADTGYNMQFTGGCRNIRIENNTFRGMKDGTGGIQFYGAYNYLVKGNVWYHAPGGTSLYACVRFEVGAADQNWVENNDFSQILAFSVAPVSVAVTSRVHVRNNKGIANPLVTTTANYVANTPSNFCYGLVQMTAAGAKTFQIQDDTKSALPLAGWVEIFNSSATDITIMAQAGSTLTLTGTLTVPPNKLARITKIAASTYHSAVFA